MATMPSIECVNNNTTSFHQFTLLILITTTILLYVICSLRTTRKRINCGLAPLPPGPKPWPIIGNLPELIKHKPRFRWVDGLPDEYNSEIACIRVNNVHIIPVKSPELSREFLKKQDAGFIFRPDTMCSNLLSFGYKSVVFNIGGDAWKKMRRMLSSEILSPRRLSWLHGKRKEEADNIIRYIYKHCMVNGGVVMDIRLMSRAYAGNVMRRQLFNRRYYGKVKTDYGPGEEEIEHVEALFKVMSFLYAFCVSDYFPILKWFDLDGHEKIIRETMTNCIDKYHDPLIKERLEEWREGDKFKGINNREPQDLLDVMVSLRDENGFPLLSFDEIRATCSELHYESIDNPSNTVEWTLAELVNNRDLYRISIEEIDSVVGKERFVQESDLPKLNYLKACLRETFRLHPFVCFNLPHVCNVNTIVGGYFIPKGSHVLLSRVQLGLNPRTWKEPLKFIPGRHLISTETHAENVELSEPELRFISFGTGRRGCMGSQLGSSMTIMLLARLLQGFDWEMPPGDSSINLTASLSNLVMEKRLHLVPKPRLPAHMYQTF